MLLFGLREAIAIIGEEGLAAARRLDLSLGVGLGAVKGKVFRIGHLGSLNELELLGGLAGVEMTLKEFGVPIRLGAGLAAAQSLLTGDVASSGSRCRSARWCRRGAGESAGPARRRGPGQLR